MKIPPEILEKLNAVKSKRPRTVIEHIIENGFITTEELKEKYGYSHPPRAARDVREQGIPLETFKVKDAGGRSIAAYRFKDFDGIESKRLGGRKAFSKKLKNELFAHYGPKCQICSIALEDRYLQIDHRIPYEINGEGNESPESYMLICGSCNRSKSWSCEHCKNSTEDKVVGVCAICYWSSPDSYKHIALKLIRRLDIVWEEDEIKIYEKIKEKAGKEEEDMPEFIKSILHKIFAEVK